MAVVAFDSLGTVFDLGDIADSASFRRALHHATCLTLAQVWKPMQEVLAAVDPDLPERLKRLEPQPDAREALEVVRDGGHEAWILTNGGRETTEQLVAHAGLTELVSRIRTVEEARRYKPARE